MKQLTSPCTLLAKSTYCDPCRCAWGETQSSVSGSAHPSLRGAQGPPRPLLTQEHGSLPRMKPGHAPPLPSLEPRWSRWLRLVLQGVDSGWNQTLVREHRPGRTDGWMDGQTVVWMRREQVKRSHPGQDEGEREDVQREKCAWIEGWKCVIFLREAGEGDLQTLPNFTLPRAFDQKAPNLLWNGAEGQRKSETLHSSIYQLLFYWAHKPHTCTHPPVTAGKELVQQ